MSGGGLTNVDIPTTYQDSGAAAIITAGAGSKGSYLQLVASTSARVKRIVLQLYVNTADNYRVDIATGGAGSEVVLIGNIQCNYNSAVGPATVSFSYDVIVPAGTRIAARAQAGAANTIGCSVQLGE